MVKGFEKKMHIWQASLRIEHEKIEKKKWDGKNKQ